MATISALLTQAQTAANAGHWSQAASLFETAYQTEQSFAINQQLVPALAKTQKYTAASTYAAEFEATYLTTATNFNLYLTILLASHQFIKAHIIVVAAQQAESSWASDAKQQVVTAEAQAEQSMAQTLTVTMRQFMHLADQPVAEQTARLAAAQHLTLTKYLTAAKFLLVDPFLSQLVRVEVLYTLRAVGIDTSVQFRWFDQTELTIVPITLPAIGQDATSQQLDQTLQSTIGQTDAGQYENLQAVLPLQLMYLYPQPEKIITDADVWIKLLIARQQGVTPQNLTVAGEKMLANQLKIQEMTAELG
ncbi:hypothetical protein [Lactobacillus sp. CBA3605] [Lactiplantibacillus mudanjiangensis]|uniref:hypothetical protein n=1 Tax=Lactiplantibacillus mudanjiangensis TaxID=1296538 RepID=UPI00101442F4|nr:hypothetical protein [Lactiplantibacillus mudanjiangensis]VDG30606.1 hypothetical protein [Lactobacillus sp. CBA3605] [Lactiplantibacillus mudanjiangensis]